MKKREVFLFLSFVALFVLFAIFQNFSFPAKHLQQLTSKEFYEGKIQKFIPTYSFKNYIGANDGIEAPYGYREEISRRIASQDEPMIFDEKKFLKEGIKTLPVYKNLKELIDVSNDNVGAAPERTSNCTDNPMEPHNNCFTEYSNESQQAESLKVRANPFRQTASVSVPGSVQSKMMYDVDRNSVNVQFKRGLHEDADLKVELDSEEKSGSINIDVRW